MDQSPSVASEPDVATSSTGVPDKTEIDGSKDRITSFSFVGGSIADLLICLRLRAATDQIQCDCGEEIPPSQRSLKSLNHIAEAVTSLLTEEVLTATEDRFVERDVAREAALSARDMSMFQGTAMASEATSGDLQEANSSTG